MSSALSIVTDSDPLEPSFDEAKQIAAKIVKAEDSKRYDKFAKAYPKPMAWGELMDADLRVDFLIENMLAKNEPMIVAGASKSLKTTISLSMAMSLATGESVFDKFTVNQKCRVLVASCESGLSIIRRNLLGMGRRIGMSDYESRELLDGMLYVQGWTPKFNDLEMVDYFAWLAEQVEADVVFLDPLYLSLDGESMSNLNLNGDAINRFVRTIKEIGATPIVNDHVKRTSAAAKEHQPIALEDISGAGKAEFFAQWVLIGRRSAYVNDESLLKEHNLWLTAGGRPGFSGCWGVKISEEFSADYSVVDYCVELSKHSDVIEEQKEARKASSQSKADQKAEVLESRMQRKATELIEQVYSGDRSLALTQSDIEGRIAVSGKEIKRVLGIVLGDGRLKQVPRIIVKNGRPYDAFMLSDSLPMTE